MDKNWDLHAPDVLERETADGGFSSGWGMHFLPREKYWLDVHVHLWEDVTDPARALALLKEYREAVRPLRVRSSVAMLPLRGWDGQEDGRIDPEEIYGYLKGLTADPSHRYMVYVDYRQPDPALIRKCAELGACGFKLFTPTAVINGDPAEVWLSDEWKAAFDAIEETGLPVLWHVTQRLTDSPYTGGGRNTYWKDGWKKGVTYTNEDLLQVYLKVVAAHPGIPFISAHQLHIGWERLGRLFSQYDNLYSDTTISCIVREFDQLLEEDRAYLHDFFVRYADRMLYGTDIGMGKHWDVRQYITANTDHIRFIKQLRLPHDALQKVAYRNFERLLGAPQVDLD